MGFQDGAKSAALLAAPGVLDPTAFFACINILHVLTSGGGEAPKSEVRPGPCWSHVGIFLLVGAFFSLVAGSRTLLALFWLM